MIKIYSEIQNDMFNYKWKQRHNKKKWAQEIEILWAYKITTCTIAVKRSEKTIIYYVDTTSIRYGLKI